MKIKKTTIKQFELEQNEYGTEIALYNVIWLTEQNILRALKKLNKEI